MFAALRPSVEVRCHITPILDWHRCLRPHFRGHHAGHKLCLEVVLCCHGKEKFSSSREAILVVSQRMKTYIFLHMVLCATVFCSLLDYNQQALSGLCHPNRPTPNKLLIPIERTLFCSTALQTTQIPELWAKKW